MEDNNFTADEFGTDEISEVIENNYSVGQIENSQIMKKFAV